MISSYFANFPLLKASKMPFYSKFLNIFSSSLSRFDSHGSERDLGTKFFYVACAR